MTVGEWLKDNTAKLSDAGIASARLDCLILLEDVSSKDRAWLLAHPEYVLSDRQIGTLNNFTVQREQHIPLAYIRGQSEFYGRTFMVDHHVLEPRPETEDVITLLLHVAPQLPSEPVIIDVGTGSGALAITAKLELPQANVYGTDIDPECLEVAAQNASHLSADIALLPADLLVTPSETTLPNPNVVLANLPYVPDNFHINPAAMNEPRIAIFGGPDGLDLFRRMFAQIDSSASKPRFVITESLPPTHDQLSAIAQKSGYTQAAVSGFVQLFQTGE